MSPATAAADDVGFVRRFGPLVVLLAAAVVVVGGLALLPARTWAVQRDTRTETEAEITRTRQQVAELEAQLTLLQTNGEIERLARENFDLVFPGEESYRILPPPTED